MKLGILAACSATALGGTLAQDFKLYGYGTLGGGKNNRGAGGTVYNVTNSRCLDAAAKTNTPKIIYVSGTLANSSNRIAVGNNTSIIGVGSTAIIEGGGFSINKVSNVIIRNLVIRKVKGNDGITVQKSNRIWIDHNEFYSDTDHGFDYYDGQVDITTRTTISLEQVPRPLQVLSIGHDPETRPKIPGISRLHTITTLGRMYTPELQRFDSAQCMCIIIYSKTWSPRVYTLGHKGKCWHKQTYSAMLLSPICSYGFVVPDDSPDNPAGDYEPDGYANESLDPDNLYINSGKNNITRAGTFTTVPTLFQPTHRPLSKPRRSVLWSRKDLRDYLLRKQPTS
ncbi:pectate lyase [Ceratobasidium sp. AG-Ba]|nr:pectate lyase [Ceratobasidium sp. AG-Ba]